MAWTKVTYDPSRQDQLTVSADQNEQGQVTSVTYQRILTYVCTSDGSGGRPTTTDVLTASDGTTTVPTAGLFYTIEGQPGYCCSQVYPRSVGPLTWEAQCTHTAKFSVQPSDSSIWNIKISIAGSKVTEPAYQGLNTVTSTYEAVTNSALQSFDPPPQRTYYDEQITVSYNSTSPPDFSALRGCTNSSSVSFTIQGVSRSFDVNQLLLDDYTLSTTTTLSDASTAVWAVSATLFGRSGTDSDGNPNTFTRNILDEGYLSYDGTHWTVIMDQYGQPVNSPQRLDGSGGVLASGGDPVYRHYQIEDQADLNPVFDGLS